MSRFGQSSRARISTRTDPFDFRRHVSAPSPGELGPAYPADAMHPLGDVQSLERGTSRLTHSISVVYVRCLSDIDRRRVETVARARRSRSRSRSPRASRWRVATSRLTSAAALAEIGDSEGESWLNLLGVPLDAGAPFTAERLVEAVPVDRCRRAPTPSPRTLRLVVVHARGNRRHRSRRRAGDAARGRAPPRASALLRRSRRAPRSASLLALDPPETQETDLRRARRRPRAASLDQSDRSRAGRRRRAGTSTLDTQPALDGRRARRGRLSLRPEPEAERVVLVPHLEPTLAARARAASLVAAHRLPGRAGPLRARSASSPFGQGARATRGGSRSSRSSVAASAGPATSSTPPGSRARPSTTISRQLRAPASSRSRATRAPTPMSRAATRTPRAPRSSRPSSERRRNVMRYTLLGRSGLRVSEVALGTMTFGEAWGWGASKDECRGMFDAFVEAGGNFVDTACNYTDGQSEEIVGELVASRPRPLRRRDEVHADRTPRRPECGRQSPQEPRADARGEPAAAPHRLRRPPVAPHVGRDDAGRRGRPRSRRSRVDREGALRRHLGHARVGRVAGGDARRAARLVAVRRGPGARTRSPTATSSASSCRWRGRSG